MNYSQHYTEFKHGDILIKNTYDVLGRHLEVFVVKKDLLEMISPFDERAREAFKALVKSKER